MSKMENDADDDFPIFVKVDDKIKTCCCCGKHNLKRTLQLSSVEMDEINLGVICASKWFNVNLSGNPFYAARRLEKHLRSMSQKDIEKVLSSIAEE